MVDAYKDDRIRWVRSDGIVLNHGEAATNGKTYYAELPVQGMLGFWAGIEWDATDVSAFTLESAGKPTSDLDSNAAAGTGWTSQATALGTVTSAAATNCGEWQVVDATARRWRVKRVVTTGGVATVRSNTKVGPL